MDRHTQQSLYLFEEIRDSPDLPPQLLPPELLQLSTSSMRRVGESTFKPREVSVLELQLDDTVESESCILRIDMERAVVPLGQANHPRTVVAVDAASIRLGQTSEGELYAIRGAIVASTARRRSFLRIGPLTFHLKPTENFRDSTGALFQSFNRQNNTGRQLYRLRNSLERFMQSLACKLFPSSLILLDGSLTVGTPDNPTAPVREMLASARHRNSRVIGLSKSTELHFSGTSALKLLGGNGPGLLDITEMIESQFPSTPVRMLGWVFVVRLAQDGFPFRLDIDRELPKEIAIDSVQTLMASDLVQQGYPESLRLAHILSTFTANEVIGLQRFISHTYGLKMAEHYDLRRMLFGPFGTGRRSFH